MHRRILFFAFVLGLSHAGICQYKNVPGIEFIKAGDRASGFVDYSKPLNRQDPHFDSARYYYREGSFIFLENQEAEQFTEAVTKYAWTFAYQYQHARSANVMDSVFSNYQETVTEADTARISFFNQWAWACLNGGRTYDAYEFYGKTISYLDSLGINNNSMASYARLYRGISARQYGMYNIAEVEYLNLLETSKDNPYFRGGALNSLAILARLQGDYNLAERYYKEVLSFQPSWQLLNNLAYLYIQMGKEQKALGILDSVMIEVDRASKGQLGHLHSSMYANMGEAYMSLKDYPAALKAFHMSVKADIATNSILNEAHHGMMISRCHLEDGSTDSAHFYLDSSSELIFGQKVLNPVLAKDYYTLKSRITSNSSIAISALDSALQLLGYSDSAELADIADKISVFELLVKKANVIRHNANSTQNSEDATTTFRKALELNRLSYQDLTTAQSRAKLMAASQVLIDDYLEYLTEQDLSESIYDEIFDLFEFNKSNQLTLALSERELSDQNPDYLRLQELDWKIRYSEENGTSDSLLVDLTIQRNKLLNNVSEENGLVRGSELFSVDLKGLRRELGRSVSFCEYFVGPENTYLFFKADGVEELHKLGKTDLISYTAEKFQQAIIDHDFQNYQDHGTALYEMLFPPGVDFRSDNLIIIPDGFISGLSFDVIPVENGTNYRNTRYLIQECMIDIHYSAGLYLNRPDQKAKNSLLAAYAPLAGNDDGPTYRSLQARDFNLAGLPFSGMEVKSAVNVLEGVSLLNSEASEAIFKANSNEYGVIHIATHNINDPYNPGSSVLIFSDDSLSAEDGMLHVSEVQSMQINARLVNLSACNTGVGEYVVGEGAMSLARGFLFAGARNVIMSEWLVDDRSTSSLMQDFYKNYKNSGDAGEALRMAKISYLENADEVTADPYYWGAWVHVGPKEDTHITIPRNVLVLIIIVLGSIIFFRVLIKGA